MTTRRTALLLVLLVVVTCGAVLVMWEQGSSSGPADLPPTVEETTNRLELAPGPRSLSLGLNEMVELDGLSRREILERRRGWVEEHEELLAEAYHPTEAVFGQIVDGKPWWGIEGMYGYGDGKESTRGAAEESRFIANPFLLIGVGERYAHRGSSMRRVPPVPPQPACLQYDLGPEPRVIIEYNVRDHFAYLTAHRAAQARDQALHLCTYNARDFGFRSMTFDVEQSTNVVLDFTRGQPIPNVQYIHVGGSCGYPGGCNNSSPHQRETEFKVVELPARLSIKLWRAAPADVQARADLRVDVELN